MAELSDQDIRDAAAEAGISPAELRSALAEQDRDLPAIPEHRGALAPSRRGPSAAASEVNLPYAPKQALQTLREALESRVGTKGHLQGPLEADIFDEKNGVIFHLRAQGDGASGALVRVDIDPSPIKNRRTLSLIALTVGVTGLALVGLLAWPGYLAALALGLGGGYSLRTKGAAPSVRTAQGFLTEAIFAAESSVRDPDPLRALTSPPR